MPQPPLEMKTCSECREATRPTGRLARCLDCICASAPRGREERAQRRKAGAHTNNTLALGRSSSGEGGLSEANPDPQNRQGLQLKLLRLHSNRASPCRRFAQLSTIKPVDT
jgi:hypothetical protein